VLLIPAICPDLEPLYHLALSLGLEPLIEVHTAEDVERVAELRPRLVGINNRDLETLRVDLDRTRRLAPLVKARCPEAILVSESGVRGAEDVRRLLSFGADAVLVGTSIMESENVARKVRELVEAEGC